MTRLTFFSAIALLSACSGGFELPDLRSSGGAASAPEPMETAAPVLTAKERLVAAVEGQGCVIDATTINAVMANASLSSTDLAAAAGELEAEGRAIGNQANGSIRIISAGCPAV